MVKPLKGHRMEVGLTREGARVSFAEPLAHGEERRIVARGATARVHIVG